MLKGIGFLLIILGSTGIGMSFAQDYCNRFQALQKIHKMVEYIADRIFVKKDPLSEAFLYAAKRMEGDYRKFLCAMYEDVEKKEGESLEHIWNKNSILLKDELIEQDLEEFCHAMEQTGFDNKEGQLRVLKDYLEAVSDKITFLKENKKEKCRLYEMVGIMSGILCILILW